MTTTVLGPTGTLTQVTVPADTYTVGYEVKAGAGCPVLSTDSGAGVDLAGGKGARITGQLAVHPGDLLWVAVGYQGQPTVAVGNGLTGGNAGKSGGAFSAIGTGPVSAAAVSNALVLAGAGGGGGEEGTGGDGGGIGSRSAGTGGGGLGGGQDTTYTSSLGEASAADGCGSGGSGLLGGRAGTIGDSDARGGGGGGSSLVPAGASITSDSTGDGAVTLIYGVAPLAPVLVSPAAAGVVPTGRPASLAWQFAGATAGDVQTGATVAYSTPAGNFTAAVSDATQSVAMNPASLTTPGPVTWTVTTTTHGAPPSPTSTFGFTLATPPTDPTITSPAVGASQTSPTAQLSWSAPQQAAYRARVLSADGTAVYTDTGVVADAAARTVALALPANARTYLLAVSVRGTNGCWSQEPSVPVATVWTRPATPQVTITARPDEGALEIDVVTPATPGAAPTVAITYRVTTDGPEGDHPIHVDADGLYRLAASDVDYAVVATAVSALGVTAEGAAGGDPDGWGVAPWGVGPWGA